MMAGIVAGGRPLVATVEAATDPYWASVSSLMHLDGANNTTTFTDQKPGSWSRTGTAKLTTTDAKFGTACLILDGSSSIVKATHASADLNSLPFTWEAWLNMDAGAPDAGIFFALSGRGLTIETVAGKVQVGSRNEIPNIITSSSNLPVGVWTHLAVCRIANTIAVYIDGVNVGSATHDRQFFNGDLQLGSYTSVSKYFKGKIDDFRLTVGVARYTANFTPPSAPFPDS